MIIKLLLFTIVLIFAYECYTTLYKMRDEYFSSRFTQEHIHSNNTYTNTNTNTNTIRNKCKSLNNINSYLNSYNKVENANVMSLDNLDIPNNAPYKPMEYNPNRMFYWRRDILIPEGIRRVQDDNKELDNIKSVFKTSTNEKHNEILQDEIDLFKGRTHDNILSPTNTETGEDRSMREIISDYFPNELGLVRPWIEIHSHIPNNSNALNYGYKIK